VVPFSYRRHHQPFPNIKGVCGLATVLGFFFLDETLHLTQIKKKSADVDVDATTGTLNEVTEPPTVGWAILKQPKPCAAVLVYCIISFGTIGYDEIYTVWCATPVLLGGIGWTSKQIGMSLMVFGIFTVINMNVLFPIWERRVGALSVFNQAAW
jgi:hypothetical protein